MISNGRYVSMASSRSSSKPRDRRRHTCFNRSSTFLERPWFPIHGRGVFEGAKKLGERIVAVASAIEDQILGQLPLFLADLEERDHARGVQDRGVEACFAGVVQEDAVD